MPAEAVVRIPIRVISVVINTEDPLSPELTLDDFRKIFGRDPEAGKYRIINIELITSPDDHQPMLATECGRYTRFLRREGDSIYFRKQIEHPLGGM